jgi:hypothetical protein
MDGDFIDSGRDTHRHVGGDPESNLLLKLEWRSHGGSSSGSHGRSRPGGSGFSMADGASAQVSVQSRGT